jgi:ubiquinone/menaquinone biosynthesis C-methylase UbiE
MTNPGIPPWVQNLLSPDAQIREVEPGLFSALAKADQAAHYDRMAGLYDFVTGLTWYNRLMWGTKMSSYEAFVYVALTTNGHGPLLDFAAGSCSVSASHYAASERAIVVTDLSLEMLRRAKTRLATFFKGEIPARIFLLQADATALPFATGSFPTLLCHGSYHVLPDVDRAVAEWGRVLTAKGALFVSSLVLSGRARGDWYLKMLHRRGEVQEPRTTEQFAGQVAAALDLSSLPPTETEGNFAWLVCER